MRLDFHSVQYIIAGTLAGISMLGYALCPADRSVGFLALATTLVGFVVGKFSNGFGSRGTHNEETP